MRYRKKCAKSEKFSPTKGLKNVLKEVGNLSLKNNYCLRLNLPGFFTSTHHSKALGGTKATCNLQMIAHNST